jgi:hypothetical protein
MLRIPDVERKPLIPRETIPPVNLSPPCDTRPDRMSETFALAVIGQIFRQERPHPNRWAAGRALRVAESSGYERHRLLAARATRGGHCWLCGQKTVRV